MEEMRTRHACYIVLHEGVELGFCRAEGVATAEDADGGLDAAGERGGDDQLGLDGVGVSDVLVHGLRLVPAEVREGRVEVVLRFVHVIAGEVQASFVVSGLAMAHQVDDLTPG